MNENVWRGPGMDIPSDPQTRQIVKSYFVYPNREMPGDDNIAGSPIHVADMAECATMCTRQRKASQRQMARGQVGGADAYLADFGTGALVPNWSGIESPGNFPLQRCNAWIYDAEKKQCWLKNKPMGNFVDQDPHAVGDSYLRGGLSRATDLHYKNHPNAYPRTYAGYLWQDLVNEPYSLCPNRYANIVNDPSMVENPVEGYQCNLFQEPRWSTSYLDNQKKTLGKYYVQPGATLPIHSYCFKKGAERNLDSLEPPDEEIEPERRGSRGQNVPLLCGTTFPSVSLSECAKMCSERPTCNSWTYRPSYLLNNNTVADEFTYYEEPTAGLCTLGRVREPYYQSTTPEDNAAISGFAIGNLSREIKRFLFG